MSMSIIAFGVMASVSILFMAATLADKWDIKLPARNQVGDSSLGPKSVNWLGAIAFIVAVLICLI
jgi:formate-dependent nitrite reductase membrane component NrfD